MRVFPYVHPILLWQWTTRKNNFHSLKMGEGGKISTLAWASVALDLGLRQGLWVLSLSLFCTLSAFIICLECLSPSPVFLHISSSRSSFFSPHSCLSVNQQATCSDSFSISALRFFLTLALSRPLLSFSSISLSASPCWQLYAHIYLSKCNYTL